MPEPVAIYQVFVDREKLLTNKLYSQSNRRAKLVSTAKKLKKLYGRHRDLVDPYNVAVPKLIFDLMVSVEAK